MYNMQKLPEQPILGNMIRTYSNILKTRTSQVPTATSLVKYEKRASWHSEVPIIAGGKHHQTSWNLLIKWILMLTLSKAHLSHAASSSSWWTHHAFPYFPKMFPLKPPFAVGFPIFSWSVPFMPCRHLEPSLCAESWQQLGQGGCHGTWPASGTNIDVEKPWSLTFIIISYHF